ncbi:unnamed protein product [Calicophoron daubneyi]|uniref:RalBP1-associated Eps domain-containing protein 2 n=1 Tax=Calicophoron daubneyi TaxID=300641 RepID=A0AAV2THZ0_CALDB
MELKRCGRDTWAHFDDEAADQTGSHGCVPHVSQAYPVPFESNNPSLFHSGGNLALSASFAHPVQCAFDPKADSCLTSQPQVSSFQTQLRQTEELHVWPAAMEQSPLAGYRTQLQTHENQGELTQTERTRPEEHLVTPGDPWAVTSEQKAYYLAQFIRLQPDPRAKLSGLQAKSFFELSRLPNSELSDIWELSDVDCDGQLTLGEFCVAMHLVVLRRNGLPIPRILPPSMIEVLTSHCLFTTASGTPVHTVSETHASCGVSDHPTTVADKPVSIGLLDRPLNLHFSPVFGGGLRQSPHLSSTMTPTSLRQRRWSISSQSDISSLAEGIMNFEARLNTDAQLQYPIPLRARTLPTNPAESATVSHPVWHAINKDRTTPTTQDTNHDLTVMQTTLQSASPPASPPPPPPRAHISDWVVKTHVDDKNVHETGNIGSDDSRSAKNDPTPTGYARLHVDSDSSDSVALSQSTDTVDGTAKRSAVESNGSDPSTIVAQLQQECDNVMQTNEHLAAELMKLQRHRIALKILLERLMPLDADYPGLCEY